MKSFILGVGFFTFVTIINFEYSECRKLSKCEKGYTGINCEIPTCRGYELCKNETTCAIKDNNHSCICQFFDNKGVYREIEHCLRKYTIPNGICFSIKTGRELCECNSNWTGSNCEKKLSYNDTSSAIININRKKKIYPKLKYSCSFTDKYNNNVNENCYSQNNITNGVCYRIKYRIGETCSCFNGWTGGDFDCNIATCDKYDGCLNEGICYIEQNRHYCTCSNGYYGFFCEKKCDISCGTGKIVINLVNSCECLCPYPYLPPNCELPITNTTQTLNKTAIFSTALTSTKTTLESTTNTESNKTTEFTTFSSKPTDSPTSIPTTISYTSSTTENTSTTTPNSTTFTESKFTASSSKPTDSLTTNPTTISYASSTTENTSTTTPNSTTSTESKFTSLSTTTKTKITENNEITTNTSNNISSSKSNIRLELISIPIAIVILFLVVGIIYHYRRFWKTLLRVKTQNSRFSNSELNQI